MNVKDIKLIKLLYTFHIFQLSCIYKYRDYGHIRLMLKAKYLTLTHIIQQYKNSIVVPVLKKWSDKSLIKSYRPISLNSCLWKVLDRIVANRLWWFVQSNNLLDSRQFGFRKGKSTIDPLLYIDSQITTSLSRRKHISIISLDFERAFDRIGIHAVIDQLSSWKMGPHIVNYIKNFMTNRKIIVRLGNCYSSPHPLYNGIPQGSPLSVILFLIAYNKLCNIISFHKEIDFIAYADDFNLFIKSDKRKNPVIDLNRLFCDIENWSSISGAILSTSKCKYIHVWRKQNCWGY